jgi:tetratricopeptide (TPR) repeat protein
MNLETASGYANVAGTNIYCGNYDSVPEYLDLALNIFTKNSDYLGLVTVSNNRAEYYMALGNYTEALNFYNKTLHYYDSINEKYFQVEILHNIADLYKKLGDLKSSNEYFEKYSKGREQILSEKYNQSMENMDARYILRQKSRSIVNELTRSRAQEKIKTYQVYLLASLLIIFIVIGGLLIYHKYVQSKFIKIQLEKEMIAKNNLKNEIEFKDKELEGMALNITNKNGFLKNLKDQLNEVSDDNVNSYKKRIRDTKFLITQYLQANKDISDFNKQVELLEQNFLFVLSDKYPKLSENDKQLCVLLRLDISSKDIALMRNVSDKSVHMARYRLRKKMVLDTDTNLVEFLRSL